MTGAPPEFGDAFLQAKSYRRGRLSAVRLIVIHDMEAAKTKGTAENVAKWFAGPTAPNASAHFNVDSDSIVQSVRVEDTAFHAPGANADGVGIELSGYAKQTEAEWRDEFSTAMLERAADLVAWLCGRFLLPAVYVDHEALLRGMPGITTHADVSRAYKRSTHTDPGPNFPMEWFVLQVRSRIV